MLTMGFQQVLQGVKSELGAAVVKLPLPKCEVDKGVDTPYLRRRMHRRLRGYCG